MGAPGQPAQDVFGGNDAKGKGLSRLIKGRDDHEAIIGHNLSQCCDEGRGFIDMLNDLKRQNHIEGPALLAQLLNRCVNIFDI